jgi:hypothetical protein
MPAAFGYSIGGPGWFPAVIKADLNQGFALTQISEVRCSLKKLLFAAALALLAALTGCGDKQIPFLVSIAVAPAAADVPAGQTVQYQAEGTYSDNSMRDITNFVTWASSVLPVAAINAGGLASTFTQGTSTVTASLTGLNGTVNGSATLTVGAPVLTSIFVTDAAMPLPGATSLTMVTIAKGTSHQFLAYGIYSDGGVRNLTTMATWSSAPVSVATITNAGLATGVTAGTATVTATDPTTSDSASVTLDVTSATVTSIAVAPANQTIAPLTLLPYTAVATFSDSTVQDVTLDVAWASSTAAASFPGSAPKNVATGVSAGTTTVSATLGGKTGSTTLSVSSATLTSITLTPSTSGVAIGSTLLLKATGTFSDSTTQSVNLPSAWSVTPSDGSIATVDNTGLVTGVAAGTATVKAKIGTVSQTATLNVQPLTSLAITPATASVAQGSSARRDRTIFINGYDQKLGAGHELFQFLSRINAVQ